MSMAQSSKPLFHRGTARDTLLPSSSADTIETKVTKLTISQTTYLTCHRKKEITDQPYYHGNLRSKEEVKKFMSKAEPGEFLLRNSFSETDSYTFSLVCKTGGVKHVKLNCHDGGSSYSLKDRLFTTIQQLVAYYSRHSIPNYDHLADVFLSRPILRKRRMERRGRGGGGDDRWEYIDTIPSHSTGSNQQQQQQQQTADDGDDLYDYDAVRDVDESVADDVMRCLHLMDGRRRETCDCGLATDESELPRGWSVHLCSQEEAERNGRGIGGGGAYFMSPDGDAVWELPLHVCLDLSAEQQRFIRRLMGHEDRL